MIIDLLNYFLTEVTRENVRAEMNWAAKAACEILATEMRDESL